MLIKVFYDDQDNLHVEIPTSTGTHKAVFTPDMLGDATSLESAASANVPDITGSTVFQRPIGEMPVRDQEIHYRATQEGKVAVVDDRELFPITRGIQTLPSDEQRASALSDQSLGQTDEVYEDTTDNFDDDPGADVSQTMASQKPAQNETTAPRTSRSKPSGKAGKTAA